MEGQIMATFNVLDFGAVGDGLTNDAVAIQKAIDACAVAGGGLVLLPSGMTYVSGPLLLKSHIELHVETGACLKASGDRDVYPPSPYRTSYTGSMSNGLEGPPHALIAAVGEQDITISGGGCIDGNDVAFMDVITQYHISGVIFPRPTLVFLGNCRKVTVHEVTLQNCSTWVLHPAACTDVLISGIRIECKLNMANSDGIDLDHCRNVRIANCYIAGGDDCIVLKTTKPLADFGPCENIVITGCTLVSTSSAFKIGSESIDDFRNILMDSCIIYNSNRALGIQLRDQGNVENVHFTNIIIETRRFYDRYWGKAEPIYVTAFDRNEETKVGTIKNVYFGNITCKGENGVYISGQPANPVREIVLDNVRVELNQQSKWEGGIYDKRPCSGEGLERRDTAGVYCANAQEITLRNVKVVWGPNAPEYYGSALETENVVDLQLENFKGKAAHPGKPDIQNR
jgi:polygalacturonase